MPLTKHQFRLGVGEETEILMRTIYGILAKDQEHAYNADEILKGLDKRFVHEWKDRFDRALEALVEIGALELRVVDGTSYYAFHIEVDQNTWQPKLPSPGMELI